MSLLLREVADHCQQRKIEHACIIIDNGSCVIRAGTDFDSKPLLCFQNVVHKFCAKATGNNEIAFGGEESDLPVCVRLNSKSAYDSNILTNFDLFELQMNHIFSKFGLKKAPKRLVITEAIGSFVGVRENSNELFHNGFSIPKVLYGIDALFAFYGASGAAEWGIVISIGFKATHLIPICNGKAEMKNAKRLNIGGWHLQDFLLKLLKAKYPAFPYKLTFQEASLFVYEHCKFASNFSSELKIALEGGQEVKIQFPPQMEASTASSVSEKKDAQQIEARRQEVAQKMRDLVVVKRKERLAQFEAELEDFMKLLALETTSASQFSQRLEYLEFDDKQDLINAISKTRESINSMREKMQLEPLPFNEEFDKVKGASMNLDFSLLSVPEEDCDEAELKERRRLRMLKNSIDARERIRKQKEKEMQQKAAILQQEEQLLTSNFSEWLALMHSKRASVLRELKGHNGTTASSHSGEPSSNKAATERLKKMAAMIGDNSMTSQREETEEGENAGLVTSKKAKKRKTKKSSQGNSGAAAAAAAEDDDNFGENDADWSIYREISTDKQESAEEIDALNEELARITDLLLKHDTSFQPESEAGYFSVKRSSLFKSFLYGSENDAEANDESRAYRLVLNVERIRVPEILFQPHIIGLDQCGISEAIIQMLAAYSAEEQQKMLTNIFATGSACRIGGLKERLSEDLTCSFPTGWPIQVTVSGDPLEAWKGALKWSKENKETIKCSYPLSGFK
jgi:actin-related protein 5